MDQHSARASAGTQSLGRASRCRCRASAWNGATGTGTGILHVRLSGARAAVGVGLFAKMGGARVSTKLEAACPLARRCANTATRIFRRRSPTACRCGGYRCLPNAPARTGRCIRPSPAYAGRMGRCAALVCARMPAAASRCANRHAQNAGGHATLFRGSARTNCAARVRRLSSAATCRRGHPPHGSRPCSIRAGDTQSRAASIRGSDHDADPARRVHQGHAATAIEAAAILRSCVHCGFCTATCPTYVLAGR
jgi:hypothetical protein